MSNEVVTLYDQHPINEFGIIEKLRAQGIALDTLTQNQLSAFDQDNYGGQAGVDVLAERAGIAAEHQVLDVCSGMGGPARWLAHTIGCKVTGIDLTQSRVDAARRLTERVGLGSLTAFEQGDATKMPFPDATFDRLISQEAWLHIPDKETLLSEVARVMRPGGYLAFTDIVLRTSLTEAEHARLSEEMRASRLIPASDYIRLLEARGCEAVMSEDLSSQWAEVLTGRLEMYRTLRDTTEKKFGAAHFQQWDSLYSFYTALFVSGTLGGVRITAKRTDR